MPVLALPELIALDSLLESFWIEILEGDAKCNVRAAAAGLEWAQAEPDVLVVRIPAGRDEGLTHAGPIGERVRQGVLGLAKVIERPAFFSAPWVGNLPVKTSADAITYPNTDARWVETALEAHRAVEARHRSIIRLYLGEMSRLQLAFGVPVGTGEKTFRFIAHFWDLGDIGVGRKFAEVAPRLGGRPQAAPMNTKPERCAGGFDARLRILEQRLQRS